jgi:hypothetical protein
MFGFWKRRRLAREAKVEAARQRMREMAAMPLPAPGVSQLLPPGRSLSSRSSSAPILHAHDPLNPLSPLSIYNQVDAYAAPRAEPEPEPVRSHCSPSVSDDSWSRSSSSGSDYGCSGSSYDSGSSSSYDSSSSSSSSDSSSY